MPLQNQRECPAWAANIFFLTSYVTYVTLASRVTIRRRHEEDAGMKDTVKRAEAGWLLFFYSVPSKPVSSRMKVWRKLAKAGAVQLKGAVYILPNSDEHYEFLQWLLSEVSSMKGGGAFVKVKEMETMKDSELVELFNRQKETEYSGIEKHIEDLERKLNSIRKGGKSHDSMKLSGELNKLTKEFDDIKRLDFFLSKAGQKTEGRIKSLKSAIRRLSGYKEKNALSKAEILTRKTEDFQNKKWATRKIPFVDRMASAWLIIKFIDQNAEFMFMEEKDIERLIRKDIVTFDVKGGDFTHHADLCTFEALVKSFGIKDKAVKRIAEIVHELDIKDGKYSNAEARGIEVLLIGIRKTVKTDADALKKGMEVFEMLYSSKT
ncbi:MAG: hypothetical protein A2Z09_00965 [Nitrospirae bacterium RBG_16_43_8]|nr:MAG: hypothetical protein A2Z09_00965 [Nitrospirae bacterium RBG_16_43_8]